MKCKRCGTDLKETDKICYNCGAIVSTSVNDLYDDINKDDDEEEEAYLDDSDGGYNKELEDLLNSYNNDTNNDAPDYSAFKKSDDNTTSVNNNVKEDDNLNITKGDAGIEDFTLDNLVEFSDNEEESSYEQEEKPTKERKKIELNFIPFKMIFVGIAIVLAAVALAFGVNYVFTLGAKKEEYKINKESDKLTSKYSLTQNPNYIKNHTWVCGSSLEDGSLTQDMSTYFQYDFNKDGTYAREFLNREDTYEDGEYSVSLESISDDAYTYKILLIANLNNGYKTKYTFTLTTNKEGTKATYKYNSSVSSCEEMEYYNNKYR